MVIRKSQPKDFNDILQLQLELEDVEIQFDNNLKSHCYDTKEGKEKLKNRIKNKNCIFYVGEEDNKVIAFTLPIPLILLKDT